MKRLIIPVVLLSAFIFYYTAFGQEKIQQLTQEQTLAPLPESLDNLFPPKADAPLFLLQMHAMSTAMLGLYSDIIQNDTGNINGNFENFLAEYVKSSQMIPEWKSHFPMDPVNQLAAALKSGNPELINSAFIKAGNTCENCHRINMARVQQKYHWDDFEQIMLTDPLSNQDVPFPQMMLFMDVSFSGIGQDLKQGQIQNAQNNMKGFIARFNTITESCIACHDTERKYFIDENVMQMIDQLQEAINQPQIDNGAAGKLIESIGNESCAKCHLVHIPAAYSKYREALLKGDRQDYNIYLSKCASRGSLINSHGEDVVTVLVPKLRDATSASMQCKSFQNS